MPHSAVTKNAFGDSGSNHNNLPVCPKPRRLRPAAATELLKPLRCTNKHSHSNSIDGRSSILNTFDKKGNDGHSGCECSWCLSSCYHGSPPDRTHNPLIHDVHFIHQMELFSPLRRTNLSDKFGFASIPRV